MSHCSDRLIGSHILDNNTIPEDEYDEMTADGVELLSYGADDTYIAKFPKWVIENKAFKSKKQALIGGADD